MAIRVPSEHVPLLKALIELSPTKIDQFIQALSDARPSFSTFKLADQIRTNVEVPEKLLSGILRVIAALYLTRDRTGVPIKGFVDGEIFKALKSAKILADENAVELNWPKLRKFFVQTLAMHRSVGTASKTGHVMTQHERIFQAARILTDVRPVFHPDVADTPDAAVVVHMLRITQRNNQNEPSDIFVAMDRNDVRRLRATIDRALAKEEAITKALSKAGIERINPAEVY
jgi:hypothetical protein